MRILVATDQWFPDYRGGSARVATDTAERLAARGHEVVVLAPRVEGQPERLVSGSLTLLRVLPRNAIPQTFSDVAAAAWSSRARRHEWFDVLLGHQSTTTTGLVFGGIRAPLARVFHASAAHEARFLRTRVGFGRERLAGYALEPALRLWERLSIRRAGRILVLSDFSRSLVLGDFPHAAPRIRLTRGGVDTGVFSPGDGRAAARARLGLDPFAPVLFTVRRLEPRMGLEQLLHATGSLVSARPLAVAIAGTGVLDSHLRRLASETGVAEHVRFLGAIDDETLRDWYRAADVVAVPTVAYEGFGLVTAEALASGTPVVGTPVGATPELLEPLDRRLVAANAEPRALASALEGVLEFADDAFRRRCRAYACARLSWDSTIADWEGALEEAAMLRSAAGVADGTSPACE